MDTSPVALDGRHVRLDPLTSAHEEALIAATRDGELWKSTVTIVPSPDRMAAYVASALDAQAARRELPFVIVRRSSGRICRHTRYRCIDHENRRVEIGATWVSRSAQRTAVNTEAKLLLLTHAFERLGAICVGFITDVLNHQSRTAILRLGAKEEGVLRNHMIMPDGRYRDSACFSITDAEWPGVKARLEARLLDSLD